VPDRITDVRILVTALNVEGANYVVIGIALILQGGAHITFDADVAFARHKTNLESIVRALAPFNPRPRGFDPELPFIWDVQSLRSATLLTLETTIGDVDLLGETPGVASFNDLFARANTVDLEGQPVRVASLEDLLAMKRSANRDKDARHILELEALLKLNPPS
jgi:hypothetical protein